MSRYWCANNSFTEGRINMRYSYNEFISLLELSDSPMAKTLYHMYLDCLEKSNSK